MTDVETLAEQAVEAFDLNEFIAGTASLPTDSVTVYTDTNTAYEIVRIRDEWDLGEPGPRGIADAGEDELRERLAPLQEKLKKSALTIHMHAIAKAEREVIQRIVMKENPISKTAPQEEKDAVEARRFDETVARWYAVATTKMVNPSGAVITDVDAGHFHALNEALHDAEWDKIVALFAQLSFAQELAEQAIDAGFPGGGSVEE